MALLSELAITPSVFSDRSFKTREDMRAYLGWLSKAICDEAVVRDLRDGEWRKNVDEATGCYCPVLKAVLKQVLTDRCPRWEKRLSNNMSSNKEWCAEALAETSYPVLGVITDDDTFSEAGEFGSKIASITELHLAEWWQNRRCSVSLRRTSYDYLKECDPLLRHARSFLFIDPYLRPRMERDRHDQFEVIAKMLEILGKRRRCAKPVIEFHRSRQLKLLDGKKVTPTEVEWKGIFEAWSKILENRDLSAKLFLWRHIHDRYFLTNLMGISLPYGFGVSSPKAKTTWSRLTREDADRVQKQHDRNSKPKPIIVELGRGS